MPTQLLLPSVSLSRRMRPLRSESPLARDGCEMSDTALQGGGRRVSGRSTGQVHVAGMPPHSWRRAPASAGGPAPARLWSPLNRLKDTPASIPT